MIANSNKFRKRSSKFFSLFFFLILLLLIGFLAVSNWRINKKRTIFNSSIGILSKKVEELEKVNKELRENLSAIPDENYLERVGRENLNLKKPGEEVVVIKKEKSGAASTAVQEQKNFFEPQKWLDWLKSKLKF